MNARFLSSSSVPSLLIATACLTFACSDADGPAPQSGELLAPPPAGKGIQLKMVTTVPAGTEAEHCQFFRAPPEGLNVNHDEIRFTTGSHHVLVYLTPYDDIPAKDELGDPVDPTRPFDCSDGATAHARVTNLLGGSQNATGESIVEFPSDVAMKVPPNAVLLLNVHYVNTSAQPLQPEVRVNIHTIPDQDVKEEGGVLFWYNPLIRVDAHGKGLATMSCPLNHEITLGNGQSHMHRRGVDYAATLLTSKGGRSPLYDNANWEGVPVKQWAGGLPIEAGSRIEYFCAYENVEDRIVWQGPRSTDEMCMFIGSYWPAQADTSLCASDVKDPMSTQSMAAEWIGGGAGTCGEALGCIQAVPQNDEFLHGLTDCVLATRPASSVRLSDAIRCMFTSDDPPTACQAEFQACMSE